MAVSQSNIGNEEQSFSQYDPIKSELHTIVDKLQLDEPPSVQTARPLWQRVLSWAVPLWLVAFFVVWCYNARVDTCGGAKVIYRGNVLCIASERDFLLLNETYETEFLARDTSEPMPIDSLNQKKYDDLTETIKSKYADTTVQDADTRTRLTFLNALRGNGMDSASYCRNLAMGYYNVAVNYLNKGNRDLACSAYRFLKDWHWKDSVLTKGELTVLEQICELKADILPPSVQKLQIDKPKRVGILIQNQQNTSTAQKVGMPVQYKDSISGSTLAFINDDLRTALNMSAKEDKKTLLYFWATYATPTKVMDEYTFTNPSVIDFLNENFICVRINIQSFDGFDFRNQYRVTVLPTIILLDSKGRAISRIEETMNPSKFLGYLKNYSKYPYFQNKDSLSQQNQPINQPIFSTNSFMLDSFPKTSVDKYINKYSPIAISESLRSGIPASIILAQSIYESNLGEGNLAKISNNYFGIKWRSAADGDYVEAYDDDVDKNGKKILSRFLKFKSVEESFVQYSELLMSRLAYRVLFTYDRSDYRSWAYGLKKAGYATNLKYAETLINIIETYNLQRFDTPSKADTKQKKN